MSSHTDKAQAVARETGWDLDQWAADHEWAAVGLGPVGIHRDSEVLDQSNWHVVYGDLRDRFGDAVDWVRFGHWAVGWIEEISWDAGRPEVVAAVEDWRARLDDYPVADETDYSEREWESLCETLTNCYDVPAEVASSVASFAYSTGYDWRDGDGVTESAVAYCLMHHEEDA
jgi:hypothetical protein